MKKVLFLIGTLAFWCGWPLLWLYFRNSKRTRLLLVCGDEFLVVKGWIGSGNWVLLGGGLHKNEASPAGLVREVHEETGVILEQNQLEFLASDTYEEYGLSFEYDCYVAEIGQKPKIHKQWSEVADYAWQPLQNPTVRLSQDSLETLRRWLSKK